MPGSGIQLNSFLNQAADEEEDTARRRLIVGPATALPAEPERMVAPPVVLRRQAVTDPVVFQVRPSAIDQQRNASIAQAKENRQRARTATQAGDGVSVRDARANDIKQAMLKEISGIKDEKKRLEALNLMLESL